MDLSKLSIVELDQLIAQAAKERASRNQPHNTEPPDTGLATTNPGWRGDSVNGSVLLRIQHGGFGWVFFQFERQQAAAILGFLTQIFASGHMEKGTSAAFGPITSGAGSTTIN